MPKTWDDLVHTEHLEPPERIMRDELIARVAALGAPVTQDRLRRWEQEERLPRPKRSGFPARSLYPAWAVRYIAAIPALLDEGKTWEQIWDLIQNNLSWAYLGDMIRMHGTRVSPEFEKAASAHAAEHEKRSGRKVAQMEIVLRDEQGRIIGRNMLVVTNTDDAS